MWLCTITSGRSPNWVRWARRVIPHPDTSAKGHCSLSAGTAVCAPAASLPAGWRRLRLGRRVATYPGSACKGPRGELIGDDVIMEWEMAMSSWAVTGWPRLPEEQLARPRHRPHTWMGSVPGETGTYWRKENVYGFGCLLVFCFVLFLGVWHDGRGRLQQCKDRIHLLQPCLSKYPCNCTDYFCFSVSHRLSASPTLTGWHDILHVPSQHIHTFAIFT